MSASPQALDALIEDYLARRRRGEALSIAAFASEHPAHADDIRELFPTLDLVERAGIATDEVSTPDFPGLEITNPMDPGIGGMGMVYRARDRNLERTVAVKTTRAHLDTPEGRAFFESEARAAARLDHPNIVPVFSFHPDHSPPYYVMQFVEGRPLHDACRGKSPLFTATVLEKVARALSYAHDAGVVHRDIKPQNILVDADDEPHITDFGLAKTVDAMVQELPQGDSTSPRGTPHFIAPELFHNGEVSRGTDIYALGITMYVLLTGHSPFPRQGIPAHNRRDELDTPDIPLPVEIDPAVPEPLQRICLKACERDPADRYVSAEAMADDLRRAIDQREVFARPTRYERERRGKLENHLTDIRAWRQQNLIDVREMDRLSRPYRQMVSTDSAWDELSRRFPWETALLRLGAWLAVVTSVLWMAFYWDQLVRWERVAALAIPCVLVNVAGWIYLRRRSKLNAIVFLSTGSLLFSMLVAVCLREYQWLRYPMSVSHELFGTVTQNDENAGFHLTNVQINIIAGTFLTYALVLLLATRARIFAFWVGTGTYGAYASLLLLAGLKPWVDNEQVSTALVNFLPPCLFFIPLAGVLLRRNLQTWAAIFYSFFPIVLATLLTLLAGHGGIEWLSCADWDDVPVQLWLMANGCAYLVIALGHARAATGFARFWGEFFMLLVPVSLLVPTNVLFEEPPFLGTAGENGIGLFEYAAVTLSIGLVVFGTRIRRATLVIPGVLGLAVAVLRITERHFQQTLAWPITLATLGGLAMACGAAMTYLRSKKQSRDQRGA